ncbi:hypothetical protein GC170_16990 [bacterium]|nr:hypothetical protein [bacterium]
MNDSDRNALESDLRDFEPVFWIGPWGDSLERLYEPDGTLYTVCLDGPVDVATDRRSVTVNRGDLVILPPAVAVELSRSARWFGIVYTGPYPYHFRERFIQVWGFEHVAGRWGSAAEVIAPSDSPVEASDRDLRHRIYATFGARPDPGESSGPEFVLSVRLEPESTDGFRIDWAAPGSTPGTAVAHGSDRILLTIPTEAVYLTHREARPAPAASRTMSPEYRPEH